MPPSFQLAVARPGIGGGGCAGALRAYSIRSTSKKSSGPGIAYTGTAIFIYEFARTVYSGRFNAGCLSHPRRRASFPEQFRTTDAPRSLAHSRDVAVAKSNHRRVPAHFLSERRGFAHSRFRTMTTTMKTKSIITIAAIALLPVAAFTQPNPPNPPPPPPGSPPTGPVGPGAERDRHEKKVPVTFLGAETSEVPNVVSEQLGLAKGFGLVVDYVVPNGPAAAAGVQQNDILKMLNDQILTEPDQLAKLVRSFAEGTNVTLTILRKGQEQKITVKLTKKEVPQRPEFGPGRHRHVDFHLGDYDFGDFGMGELKEQMQDLKEQLGDAQHGVIHDAVMKAHEAARRARDEARRATGEIRILSNDDGALKATKIDIGKAQIVFSDEKGEMKLET